MAKFKKGDTVRQVVPVITGQAVGYSVDQQTGDTQIHASWSDTEGDHSRFCTEAGMEAAPAPVV